VAEFFGKLVFRTNGGLLSYLYDFPARDAVTPPSGVPQEATGWQIATTKGGTAQAWKAQRFLLDSSGAPSQDPDLAAIVLYRYKGVPDGKMKGPVVLSPGYGTTVLSFACLTNSTQGATDNLVIQLLQAGYDVWLYDNRSRPRAAKVDVPHFTLDDIAQTDWPAAVNFILQTTGANTVQVMGHCVGAMSAQMALLAGGLEGKVRSMVSSQLTVQPVTNWFNQAKADIDLASILAQSKLAPILQRLSNAGLPVPQALIDALTDTNDIDAITPPGASSDSDQLLNLMAWYAPFGGDHPCDSPTCHRIFAIFGPSYLHDNLNEATHNAIRDFFGKVTMSSFVQLGQIVAAGHAVDASGGDAYMPNVARLNLPIHFIAGAKNLEFLPDTSLKTLRWLQTSLPKGAGPFSRKLYHSYGHMDFFIGRNAGQDIFPDIVAELDKYN
jgi:pimeloyl-ACP methyl ester carboxylesterase